jgi:Tfp pilus assembly protein PilN
MIRSNLATRPFYNERAAHALLALLAAFVVAITGYNVYRIVSLSSRNTQLSEGIRRDEEAAAGTRRQTAALRARINEQELSQVAAGASEANALIDQRTFSWTEFFNLIERTLPDNVMLTSVTPRVDNGETQVTMTVVGRRPEDLDSFMEQLEATKAFQNVLPRSEDMTDDGLHRIVLAARYAPPAGAASAPAPADRKAPPHAAAVPADRNAPPRTARGNGS